MILKKLIIPGAAISIVAYFVGRITKSRKLTIVGAVLSMASYVGLCMVKSKKDEPKISEAPLGI